MRREDVIFYAENHIFGNAIRRCLLYKNKYFYREIVLQTKNIGTFGADVLVLEFAALMREAAGVYRGSPAAG